MADTAKEAQQLLPFAISDTQREILQALVDTKSLRGAAEKLGLARSTVFASIKRARRYAAARGFSPDHDYTRAVPEGFVAKGVSTYYDKDGQVRGQWVKSSLSAERAREVVEEAIRALSEDIPRAAPIAPPKTNVQSLLAVYPFGDPHFGMYAWAQEAGDDFDLDIARNLTLAAVDRLVDSAPAADTAVILPLGDVFHIDSTTNQTPASKNTLDADGRFVKVLGVGIQTFRHVIQRALEKHRRVVVRFVGGNHDPHSIWALALTIAAYFEKDPRVEVDLSPSLFWYFRFGKVLIGATHGDKAQHKDLNGIMAADRAKDWGDTKHRYWYTGHIHTRTVTESPGVICESFRTLAAKDAWAAGMGYRAGRDMLCIIHHAEHGEVERHRCDVGMIA
jgi:DNA-binding CsgD family transcriptional regulator